MSLIYMLLYKNLLFKYIGEAASEKKEIFIDLHCKARVWIYL